MLSRRILTLLRAATGLDLSQASVNRVVQARMQALGEQSAAAYALRLDAGGEELQALIDEVVVPETWFMREPAAFDAAATIVEKKRADGLSADILCLPCASGEEPYSLAIRLLGRGIPATAFRIRGVDISAAAIMRAQRALYPRNAFRGTDSAFLQRHFTQHDGSYQLADSVRGLVQFARANLLDADAPALRGQYDIVFCRNLLIYFDLETQESAIQRLRNLLRPDGVLFSGYAEAATFCRNGFAMAPFPRAFALVREQRRAPSLLAAISAPAPASSSMAPTAVATSPGLPPWHRPRLRLIRSAPAGPRSTVHPEPSQTHTLSRMQEPASRSDNAALMSQARALADEGRLNDAAKLFRRCVQQTPDSAEAHFMLGLLSERMQEFSAALECMRRAVYLDPAHYEALCHLALLQEQHGQDAQASALRARAARVFQRRQEGRLE